MGMTQYGLAFSFTAYTWPLNSEALLCKGNQHFGILSALRNCKQVSSQACCNYYNHFYILKKEIPSMVDSDLGHQICNSWHDYIC